MAISASEIQNIVTKEDDFGHEMRVGGVLRGIPSADVQHGGTYTDPVTRKPRQFDFRCSVAKASTRLVLAVECKNLNPCFPLVVCGTKRRNEEAFHDLIEAAGPGAYRMLPGGVIVSGSHSLTKRAQLSDSFYPPGEFVGKNVVRLKPGPGNAPVPVAAPDTDIYEKWAQALSSGVGLADLACEASLTAASVWSAVLPVVVVADDSFWKVVYNEEGRILSPPEHVGQCEFYTGRQIKVGSSPCPHRFTFSHIHFFTLSGFSSFLSEMTGKEAAWKKLLNPSLFASSS